MPAPTELRPVDPAESEAWTAVVSEHPDATVFHTAAWTTAVESTFGYEPAHHLVYPTGGNEPVGAVPAFHLPGLPGPTVGNPFCEYGFPLLAADVDPAPVLRSLASEHGTMGARVLKDAGWTGNDAYNAAGYGAVETGAVLRLDTARPFEAVRATSFTAEARRCVRIAEERGLRIRPGTLAEYYPLYRETMNRLGSPQFPESFFLDLAAELTDDLLVMVAFDDAADETDGEADPVGGLLALDHAGTRMIWSSASQPDAWDAHPNHACYAAAIEDACVGEIDVVDFGRSRPGTGVHDYKLQFGGTVSPLASFVSPPHRTGRASLEGYGHVAPIAERFGGVLTHPAVGPRLKRFIHE